MTPVSLTVVSERPLQVVGLYETNVLLWNTDARREILERVKDHTIAARRRDGRIGDDDIDYWRRELVWCNAP